MNPAEDQPTRSKKRPMMVFGWCTSGHHKVCRGSVHRPNDAKGEEQPDVHCSCPCHDDPDWVDPRTPSNQVILRRDVFTYQKDPEP